MAGTALSNLHVSMTVLASCAVSTESSAGGAAGLPGAVSVVCPPAYPFRASITRNARTGLMATADLPGLHAAGRRQLTVSQLEAGRGQASPAGPATLTIAY
jgi:hypothetical protein